MPSTVTQSTTQKFLEIYDVTNDIVILKDGATALILTVNAMNFGLLAEAEQDAIIYSYAGLLNSINYPIQIVIRSQTKDVTKYLKLLEEEEAKAGDDIKRGWINRYRGFVSELIKERNVLDKKFYVVIPASALEMGLLPPSTVLPGVKQPDLSTVERSVILEKAIEILEPKRDHLLGQLGRIGLIGRQLVTQEIIQLFYLSYNPEAAEGQQITDTSSYTTPLVQASVQGGFMAPDLTTPSMPTPGTVTPTPAANPMPPQPTVAAPAIVEPSSVSAPVQTPASAAPTPVEPMGTTPSPTINAAPVVSSNPPEVMAQTEINSTLQQLGTPGLDVANSIPTPDTSVIPESNVGSMPPTPSDPGVSPTLQANPTDSLQPLPEI